LERICNDAGFATTHKRVLTSEDNRRADLEIRNIRVAQQTDLLVDVTVRHNFKGTGLNWQTQGPPQPRQPGPHHQERRCRQDPQLSRHISPQPACGFLAGVHVYLGPHPRRCGSYPTNRQKTILRPLVISRSDRSFVTVAASSSSKPGAPSGWHVLRLLRGAPT
jgi:hypothetical protein